MRLPGRGAICRWLDRGGFLSGKISLDGCPNRRRTSVIVMAAYVYPPTTHEGDSKVKYILMDYVNEAGWPILTKAEKEHWLGAYLAYIEAMKKAGVLKSSTGLQPTSTA